MSLTILIVLLTALVAGVGFWFYNRRQINSLTEKIEDKNVVISSLREHLVASTDAPQTPQKPNNGDRKKKRYSNRQKKAVVQTDGRQPKQKQNKPRKPKPQQ